jgi:signal peptidase II
MGFDVRGTRARFLPIAIVAGVVVALDQLTKLAVQRSLGLHDSVAAVDGLVNVIHARNPGAAFSFLAEAPEWFRGPFFVAMTVVAVVVLLVVAARLPLEERWLRLALGGVLGGALGNVIDRLLYGEVVDFIDVYWGPYHWPAFNVADSSITISVAVVLLHSLLAGRAKPVAQLDHPPARH